MLACRYAGTARDACVLIHFHDISARERTYRTSLYTAFA